MKAFNNVGKNENWLLNQYEFEQHFRHILVASSSLESFDMMKHFDQAHKSQCFKADKLFLIWEANYYIYTIQNERLARLRFQKIFNLSSNNVEACFQEWLITSFFEKTNIGVYEDISTIYYALELENIKTKDQIFCSKLIDFWNEVISSSPKIERLNLLSKAVSEHLDALDAGYSDLVKKFPNRIACHSLYGSLQTDILRREESGSHLIKKKESLLSVHHQQENKIKSLSFSDSNGFLVISANEDSFGTIAYADSIVSLILNQDVSSIIGSKYYAYIPEPFAKNHDRHLENCLENNKNPELSLFLIHFLQTARGYLVECACEAHLIPLIQEIYFVVIMQPISKTRECALLLKDGTICSHSERFLNFIQCPKITGKNENIDELIPDLNFSMLKSHDSVLLNYNNKPVLFVLINTTTKSTVFNLLLLIHDKGEIEEWSQGKDGWQQDLADRCIKRFQKINYFNGSDPFQENEYEGKNNLESRELLIKDENKISERLNSNTLGSSHSSMSFSSIGKKMKRNAQATLSWIKWSLLASILMIITMTCGVLLYIWKEISHSNDIESTENLAGLLHEMTIMAHLSRAIDLSTNYSDLNTSFYLSLFTKSVNSLDSLQNTILSDYDSWSYCPSSEIVNNKMIPIWNIRTLPPLQYYTLYDTMSLFVKHGKSFLDAYMTNNDYRDDELFLIGNGLGQTYKVLSSSVKAFLKCETDRVKNDDALILLLLLMDGFLSVSLSLGIILLIIQFHRAYNEIWNFIRKQANGAYIELFHSCFDRLSTVHCWISDKQEIRKINKGTEKPISENFSKRFAGSLSIIIVCFSFCVWSIGEEYNSSCKANLIKRYELLEAYYIRVSQISEACYWVCELSIGRNETTEDIFGGVYGFSNANHMIIDITDRYNQALHVTSNMKYRELFSNNLHKLFFEEVPDALDHIFDFGTYYGSMIMKNEFTFYAYSNDSDIPKEIGRFLFQAGTLQNMIKSKTPIFNKGSRDFVNTQFKNIVYVMICFVVISLLAYFLLYLPIIIRENHKLQKLYEISQLIPFTYNKK
ncbi:unnamed protein product [Blepharisma stoltei]|uniref:TmcB/TmcC TPR repeats domain-containing protein n=1 Tax=Blepharisma stoltei TaxID=1481888 RepID=A0AAU9IB03_9CILI|nr:unnamed protein product [Blepharisma stoltei]